MLHGKKLHLMWAMDEHRLIGNKNKLPWESIVEDMVYFKKTTTPFPVLIGRNTWNSIPERFRPLKGRQNIVLSRNKSLYVPDGVVLASTFEEALAQATNDIVFVIGGAEIYRLALPHADKLYITHIRRLFRGDVYFPEYNIFDWRTETTKGAVVGPQGGKFRIDFSVYTKIEKAKTIP